MTLKSVELDQFIGTESWHRWTILFPNFFLTDGALYVAEEGGAFWLMDAIASFQPDLIKAGEYFQVWQLAVDVDDGSGVLTCEDGNGNPIAHQQIGYTDFPLSKIKLYAIWDGEALVILLPSEY